MPDRISLRRRRSTQRMRRYFRRDDERSSASSGTGTQTALRSDESRTSGVIYVEFGDRIDVYPKTAQGTRPRSFDHRPSGVRPARTRPVRQSLRGGHLLLDGSRVSHERSRNHTNCCARFSAPDPQHPTDQHVTLGLSVRYDGGIAMIGQRSSRTTSDSTTSVIGVFSAHDGGFDILQERPESVGGLTVDGVGNILFAY